MTHPYATKEYAESLSHYGEALYVPAWNTHVITRVITPELKDATGIYPITVLPTNADLQAGLDFLRVAGMVSIVLVADDFHRPSLEALEASFDFARAFKQHYVYRPSTGPLAYDRHHRYELKQALKQVRAGELDLKAALPQWIELYQNLVQLHGLKGVHDFPAAHHAMLAAHDGFKAFGAWIGDALVSCHIWAVKDGYAHSHLAASSEIGYKSRAAYAVNDAAATYFKAATLLNFGGGAGFSENENDGLAKFKKGFSNDQSNAYICGAVLDKEKYNTLMQTRGLTDDGKFFPAYRA